MRAHLDWFGTYAELTQCHIMKIPYLDIVLQFELVDNVCSSEQLAIFFFPLLCGTRSVCQRWVNPGLATCCSSGRCVHRVLVGKPEEKRPLGRPRRRWEDNIKTDLQEMGGSCGDWMELAQDRERWRALVSTVGR